MGLHFQHVKENEHAQRANASHTKTLLNNQNQNQRFQPGLQKVGTAGTAGAGQVTFGWTK